MTMDVITIDENALVKEAAEIMNQHEIGCLIAVRKGKAIGIITERDLLKRVIVEDKNAKKTKVGEIMSSPLEVVAYDIDIAHAEGVKVILDCPKRRNSAVGISQGQVGGFDTRLSRFLLAEL